MNTYTVIVYAVPARAQQIETVVAQDASDAEIHLRDLLLLEKRHCEVVGVILGRVRFELVDCSEVSLAPYCGPVAE